MKREGLVEDGSLLSLFTPEQLVATSNDDVNVRDVINMVKARGGSPTLPPSPKRSHNNSSGNDNEQQQPQYHPSLTVHGALNNVKSMLTPISPEENVSLKRDVVQSFRERERLAQLPTYSSTPDEIKMNDARRREIESEVLGTPLRTQQTSAPSIPTTPGAPTAPAPASVPASSFIAKSASHQRNVSMGDIGAYRDLHDAKQKAFARESSNEVNEVNQVNQVNEVPPPAPPAGQPPQIEPDQQVDPPFPKTEIQLMRERLELLKQQNASLLQSTKRVPNPQLADVQQYDSVYASAPPSAPPSAPLSAPPSAPPLAPQNPISNSLAEKILHIKMKAKEDLADMWNDDTVKAKNIPLPTDHGVNNNRAMEQRALKEGLQAQLSTPTPNIKYSPSLSEMLRRESTKFDGNQQSDFDEFRQ